MAIRMTLMRSTADSNKENNIISNAYTTLYDDEETRQFFTNINNINKNQTK